MGIIIRNGKQYGFSGKVGTASSVLYDNTNSQIEVATVQEAIDYILENGVSGGGLLEVDLTKVEYEEMVAQDVIVDNVTYYITDDDDEYNANTIVYDNTDTGLESGNVQGAITEINAKVNEQNKNFEIIPVEIDANDGAMNIFEITGFRFGKIVFINGYLNTSAITTTAELFVIVDKKNSPSQNFHFSCCSANGTSNGVINTEGVLLFDTSTASNNNIMFNFSYVAKE